MLFIPEQKQELYLPKRFTVQVVLFPLSRTTTLVAAIFRLTANSAKQAEQTNETKPANQTKRQASHPTDRLDLMTNLTIYLTLHDMTNKL